MRLAASLFSGKVLDLKCFPSLVLMLFCLTQADTEKHMKASRVKRIRVVNSSDVRVYTFELEASFEKVLDRVKSVAPRLSIKFEGKSPSQMNKTRWEADFSAGKAAIISLYPGKYIEGSLIGTAVTDGGSESTTIELVTVQSSVEKDKALYNRLFKACGWGFHGVRKPSAVKPTTIRKAKGGPAGSKEVPVCFPFASCENDPWRSWRSSGL